LIVLFFADVVGKPGRELLIAKLPELRRLHAADAVVVNG
jgi:calcineurin-like phosphoesterase